MSLLHRKPKQHRWVIVSGENRDWTCRLGPCLKTHAVSVLAQLEADPSVPNELRLVKAA